MKYRLLGQSGLRVSNVGLGTLNFGETKDWGVPRDEALKMLGCFAERGGTLIDTAPNYSKGAAEDILGEFLRTDRDRFVLSTKYTASNDRHVLAGGNSLGSMVRSVEGSLRRLGIDCIDLLWCHYWDGTTPLVEVLRAAEMLIQQGKIRYFAFSDTPAWLVSRAVTMAELRGWSRPVAVQLEYNLAAREVEADFFPMAEALDLGVIAWAPLAAGAFAAGGGGKRRPVDAVPATVRAAVDTVGGIADTAGLDLKAVALRYILQQGAPAVVPLIGARTSAQLGELLDAAESEVPGEVLDSVNAATRPSAGFPNALIGSPYLRRLALGDPEALSPPSRPRA